MHELQQVGIASPVPSKITRLQVMEPETQSQEYMTVVGLAMYRASTGEFVYVSEQFAWIMGRSKREFIRLNFKELTIQKYHTARIRACICLKNSGSFGPMYQEFRRPDGSFINAVVKGRLMEFHGEPLVMCFVEHHTPKATTPFRTGFSADFSTKLNKKLRSSASIKTL